MGAGQGGLRVARKLLGAPFKVAGKIGGLLSPKKKAKKWARRIRRLALLVLMLVVSSVLVPTAIALSDDRSQELAAMLSGGLAEADQSSANNNGGGGSAAGPGGSTGTVNGIPYADIFNSAGREAGIDPRLLAAVAWAESGFSEDVMDCSRPSSAGALGIMQLMPGTARLLRVNACKPEEAIPGAARYLKQQYDKFGTWELALAAYNAGPGNVESCRCIPEFAETQAYVPKVMDKWEEYKRQFPDEQITGGGIGNASPERQAIIQRAYAWLNVDCAGRNPTDPHKAGCGVAYSMEPPYHSDGYRRDCSGYVSMAWGLGKPGATTVTLDSTYAREIDKGDLQPGDILLKALSGANGHVVLFESWVDDSQSEYWGLEQVGGSTRETIRRRIPYPYFGSNAYVPYRWERFNESGGGGGASNTAD